MSITMADIERTRKLFPPIAVPTFHVHVTDIDRVRTAIAKLVDAPVETVFAGELFRVKEEPFMQPGVAVLTAGADVTFIVDIGELS